MAKNTREKTKRIAENKDKRPYATARHIRMSPYKVRRALALIRGKSVNEAAAILTYATIVSAEPVKRYCSPPPRTRSTISAWTAATSSSPKRTPIRAPRSSA